MRTMHGIFDVNNDGVISFDDFIILADKFGDLGHLSEKEMEDFRDVMKVISNIFLFNNWLRRSLKVVSEVLEWKIYFLFFKDFFRTGFNTEA